MEECVILFLHHNHDEITKYNLESFKKYNPYFKVVALSPNSSPKSKFWLYDNMWMHNDTMIYDWLDSDDFIDAKKYCWFDWDTQCKQSVDEYYNDSWNADITGTNIFTPKLHSSWQWFHHAKKKQELNKYHDKFLGITPFCGILMSKEALLTSVNQIKKENNLWKDQMNELRLPTCSNICGFQYKELNRNSIQPFSGSIGNNGQIIHPVKIIIDNNMNKIDKFQEIIVVSSAFSTTDEIVRDLNASREIYKNWNIHFLGRGEPMVSYIEAKILALKKFVELNIDMFEWLLVLDSNDTLVLKDFDSEALKKLFESFQKPIIFSGEANCYPLEELRGLYTSNAKIKYLNSGVMVVHKNFILKLLDHVLYLYNAFPQYAKVGYNPPGDQTYYSLCLFSKELGENIIVDTEGLISVSTALVSEDYFTINNGLVYNTSSRPYILHCQGNDKHARKRDFMKKLNIPIRG